ncbi:uncharacterized protein LOC132746836 isoform X2 [Ruditapes philippinarum]|uniref:uncharacterized protein LOC132746836 isoform X2 n=1 Tax=Ruditapes philippinarum TaxID=129788 RepID=UPI00295B881F|nr:uncharacterized protein LOC132746836 isoform X2 [Ruditapes philippinarum]
MSACYLFILLLFACNRDVSSFTLTASTSADKAILGDNPFTLSCHYTLTANDQLFSIELQRKRGTGTTETYETIVTFQNPSSPLNVTYQDTALEHRTIATKPTEQSKTATLVFNTIECEDKATYNCKALYTDGAVKTVEDSVAVIVKANPNALFEQGTTISYTPNTFIKEGDNVIFQCIGDVGNEKAGHLGWFYYLGSNYTDPINASAMAISQATVFQPSTCSSKQASTLHLTMLRSFNNMIVRCTVQHDTYNEFGDGYAQTQNIPVYYPPVVTAIGDKTVDVGTKILTLNCVADANPPPIYSWFLPNGTVVHGPNVSLTNIQIENTGVYTCLVYNVYAQIKHTAHETVYIDVRNTTTPAPTLPQTTAGLTEVPTFSQMINQGRIDSSELDEASGLAASRLHPGILYSHNDNGDSPRLFAINASTARVVATLNISPAYNNDWEDIAVGPCAKGDKRTCIYILDDGNYHHGVHKRTIYRVVEPDALVNQTVAPDSTYKYNWTEVAADTIMVDNNADIYVISTKVGGHGKIAKLPAQAWGQKNRVYIDSGSYLSVPSSHHHDPAGGDISPDGTEVLVKTKDHIYYWKLADGDIVAALTQPGIKVPYHKERAGEAVCWSLDGSAYYTLGEGHHQMLHMYKRA